MADYTRAEFCAVAVAEAFRGDGQLTGKGMSKGDLVVGEGGRIEGEVQDPEAPVRKAVVAPGTTTPFTYHSYKYISVSPSASNQPVVITLKSSPVRAGSGVKVAAEKVGAVLATVTVLESTEVPLSRPSNGVTVN